MTRGLIAVAAAVGVALACAPMGAAAKAPRGSWYPFAPYVDVAEYPPPDLGAIGSKAKVGHVTLGFVTALGGNQCRPSWGGYAEYPGAGAGAYRLAQVRAYNRGARDAVVSFGGQAGTELAKVCASAEALAGAYRSVLDTYGASHADFDIEGAIVSDTAANTRRAQAIALLQRGRRLRVSYTLAVLPTGLDSSGLAIARNAVATGVSVSVFNVMAMDYGDDAAPSPRGKMAAFAVRAARATHRQLKSVYPRLSSERRWRRVGITPMLGVNDVTSEVFGLSDARKLVKFARGAHPGSLGMWQLGRDRPCATPTREARNDCSGVRQKRWAYSRVLRGYRG